VPFLIAQLYRLLETSALLVKAILSENTSRLRQNRLIWLK